MILVILGIVKILIGLAGLGVIVFVHELGHFIAARLCGITVEAFSLGWGPPLLRKKAGGVEYRLGAFPLGGYCKMSGEQDFETAWEKSRAGTPLTPGSFFAAAPWKRIITAAAGPLFNILFAVAVFAVVWGIGFEYTSMDNRIALSSEAKDSAGRSFPADRAGLATGDRIIAIDGKTTENFSEIQRIVAVSAEKKLRFDVERGGEMLSVIIEPELQKESGMGLIGVTPGGEQVRCHTPRYSVFGALAKGGEEAWWMLDSTVRGLRLLFRGVDVTQAVAGPARITWMAGEIAAEGFARSAGDGIRLFANILALISIALGVMNLLPLPVLDGGAILLYLIEQIRRKPLNPKILGVIQMAGIVIIAGLIILSFTSDMLFFMRK